MRKAVITMILACFLWSCMIHRHTVHSGALGNTEVRKGQWYLFYGLLPLNNVDTRKMAKPHTSYEITTEITFTDILVSAILSPLTIMRTSVIVRK